MEEFSDNLKEQEKDYVSADKFLGTLGQMQYVMRPLTNSFPEEYPFLGEDIRYSGSYDNYHDIKIHKEDIVEYANRYIDYKNSTSPFKIDKEEKIKEIKSKLI